jgi:hypothetical protein
MIAVEEIRMSTSSISIEVDADAAQAYAAASEEQKRKLQLLLSLRLRELVSTPARPLTEIMDQMGAEAQQRGLTPEILDSMLRDDAHANGV